jgi:thioredoxin-related protein
MEPIVHGLEDEYSGKLDFVYYDIDAAESSEAMREYNFRVQPHFILLNAEGDIIQEWFGSVPVEQFIAAFEEVLAN